MRRLKMTEIEEKYIEFLCAGAFSKKKNMEAMINAPCDKSDTLKQCFLKKFNISEAEFMHLQEIFKEPYRLCRNRAPKERVKEFGGFEKFCLWYMTQEKKCEYCGISEKQLVDLRDIKRGGNLTLNNAEKRKYGYLEIEKRDPKKGYSKDNVVLACPFCNNAKSNLISEKDWIKYFAPVMKEYIEDQLSN
jgi:hypothetical protein